MKIGIVILNYKTYLDTEILVKEIIGEETQHELFIQVVDNASPNESAEYLSKKLADMKNVFFYANNENSGFAKGNNIGLRLLKEYNVDYALVLNNDIHFELSVLDKLIETYNKIPDSGVIAPLQKLPNGELEKFRSLNFPTFLMDVLSYTYFLIRFEKKWEYKQNTDYSNVQKVSIIPGCFIFIDYKLFESVGFFDECTFLFCEERFLSKKMTNVGKSNYLLLDCSYIHDHSKTIKKEVPSLNQRRLLHDGRIKYTKKYRSFPLLKTYILSVFWYYSIMIFKLYKFLKK